MHAALDNRMLDAEHFGDGGFHWAVPSWFECLFATQKPMSRSYASALL
jgi:hypothetical protein